MGSTSGSTGVPRAGAAPDDDLDLIDLEQLAQSGDFSGASWSSGSGEQLSLVEWCARTGGDTDSEDERTAHQIHALLDAILNQEKRASSEKTRLDSRTFVRPKRRSARPGLHTLLQEDTTTPARHIDKFLTYNKYNAPFRLDTLLLEDKRMTDKNGGRSEGEERGRSIEGDSSDAETHSLSRPIDIDLSQPANNLHTTFTRGMAGLGGNERNSLSMLQSGTSFLNMSPPSLVNSILMDSSIISTADVTQSQHCGGPTSARESLDPHSMLSSMTLSIMEDKDMSTSFLSQSTCHEQDSLIGSLPPSMPSSVDSSYHTPAPPLAPARLLSSLVDSTERLTMRPRADLFTVPARRSDTFSKPQQDKTLATSKLTPTRAHDDARQHYESPVKRSPARYRDIMNETVNMTYNKARLSASPQREKECTLRERNGTFQKDSPERRVSPHYRHGDVTTDIDTQRAAETPDMQRTISLGRGGLQLPLDKTELSEITQARHKLSLARSALPRESSPLSTTHTRRSEETPQRNATFKKHSPRAGHELEATMIYVKDNSSPDINSATVDLVDAGNTTLQHEEEWGQRCAMVGSSDSADTATLSSSSPPETVHERNAHRQEMSLHQVASTPLGAVRKGGKDLLNLQHHISPIYNERPVTTGNINTATMVRRPNTAKPSPNKLSPTAGVGATTVQRSSGLPTSKLRQYSSHKELSRIPGSGGVAARAVGRGGIQRRNVYASNPALSPTAPAPPAPLSLQRRDSYTISVEPQGGGGGGGRGELRAPAVPVLVRQGTETLRRPHSQLALPRESGGAGAVSSLTQLRVRPSATTHRPVPVSATSTEPQSRGSALPRPSRLPAPRRTIRPPSVYSVAGAGTAGDTDHY